MMKSAYMAGAPGTPRSHRAPGSVLCQLLLPNVSCFSHLQCSTFSSNNILLPLFDLKTRYTCSGFVMLMVFLILDMPRVLFQVLTRRVSERRVVQEGFRTLMFNLTPFLTLYVGLSLKRILICAFHSALFHLPSFLL